MTLYLEIVLQYGAEMRIIRYGAASLFFLGSVFLSQAVFAEPFSVTVVNASTQTKCAEEDNVYIKLQSPDVTKFSFDALQPVYARKVRFSRTAPDFTDCSFGPLIDAQKAKLEGKAPAKKSPPPKLDSKVLYEDDELIIKGVQYPDFWRKTPVPMTINGKSVESRHLIQVFTKRSSLRGKPFEYLVLYPQDGYWRSRMMPVKGRGDNVYGASFLIGPVEEKERPFVDISSIAINTKARRFDLAFARGGSGQLNFNEPTPQAFGIVVSLKRDPANASLPFAAFRSMYVSETNADTARLMWRSAPNAEWRGGLLPSVKQETAMEVKLDRVMPSKHNTLSPDFVFRNFEK